MVEWHPQGEWSDIRYETAEGIAKITIDRPDVRNAFRPRTTKELILAFERARDDPEIGVVILTGEGTEAFSSGGDQRIRGDDGYVDEEGIGRLNVLDLQIQIRRFPKPVIAMVAGYAIGGGHVLHLCCDLTIAADNARFGQTGPRVGSFDGGYGIGLLARQIGEKRAKEVWFLCRQYDAVDGALVGTRERRGTHRRAGSDDGRVGEGAAREVPARAPIGEGGLQRRRGRPRGRAAAGRGCDAPVLHDRGSAGRQERVPGQARPRLREVPETAVSAAAGWRVWWLGARPRTLGAGLVPVLVGTAAAGHVIWWRFAAALLVAAGLQIGVNLANDYFDGVRGVDTTERLGPPRLTQSGAASPRAVLIAALASIFVAGVAGLALALATEPAAILVVGALAIVAAFLYSGGPRPYAGLGLGEVMVFVFFGLVATCGTTFVMVDTVTATSWWCAAVLGFLAVAILEANNIRDIATDAASGKRTLAVRIGDRHARALYGTLVVGAFLTIVAGMLAYILDPSVGLTQWGLVGLAALPFAIQPLDAIRTATGRELIPVLIGTAKLHAATGLLLTLGLVLSHTV